MIEMIKMIKRILDKVHKAYNSLIYYSYPISKKILIDADMTQRNFGDDMNVFLVEAITGKKVFLARNIFHKNLTKYLIIGSILEWFTDENSIVWGSGAMYGDRKVRKPKQICAVRGKFSRELLLRNNIECPEIYGDPALLLPILYSPKVEKKYRLGIIPHVAHRDNLQIRGLCSQSGVKFIDFGNYTNWKDVVEQINECSAIASSSLHGLILADAYKIPNVWFSTAYCLTGGTFKFCDYFSGVGRETATSPIFLDESVTVDSLLERAKEYKGIDWNPEPLIKAAPFKLKNLQPITW